MPKNLTPNDPGSFPMSLDVPQDGDDATASTGAADVPVEDVFQALYNAVYYVSERIGLGPSLSPNQVYGRKSTGPTGGKTATDFSFALFELATAIAYKDAISTQGADIAAAATTDIASATGHYVVITGTGVTINALGTATAGVIRFARFEDTNTLAHSASLRLPGAANIVTDAGDILIAISDGGGAWRVAPFVRAGVAPPYGGGGNALLVEEEGVALLDEYDIGTTEIAWRPALAFVPSESSLVNGQIVGVAAYQGSIPAQGWQTFEGKQIPLVSAINALSQNTCFSNLAIAIKAIDGSADPMDNEVIYIRRIGPSTFIHTGTTGDVDEHGAVYLGDDGYPSLTPGTNIRRIGEVVSLENISGWTTFYVHFWFDGTAGQTVGLDPHNLGQQGVYAVSATGQQDDYAPGGQDQWDDTDILILSSTADTLDITGLAASKKRRKLIITGSTFALKARHNASTESSAGALLSTPDGQDVTWKRSGCAFWIQYDTTVVPAGIWFVLPIAWSDFVADSESSAGQAGLVPAPAAGDASAGKFLGVNGWEIPAGAGGEQHTIVATLAQTHNSSATTKTRFTKLLTTGYWHFEVTFHAWSVNVEYGDYILCTVDFSGTIGGGGAYFQIGVPGSDEAAYAAGDFVQAPVAYNTGLNDDDSVIKVSGRLQVTAPGNFTFKWKPASDGNNLTMRQLSVLRLTKATETQ